MSRLSRTAIVSGGILAAGAFFGLTLWIGMALASLPGMIAVCTAWVVFIIWLADPLGESK